MKPGDKVVCIESAHDSDNRFEVKKGRVYTILDLWNCSCHTHLDVGLGSYTIGRINCIHCGKTAPNSKSYVPSYYFRPIEYPSAHEELMNKTWVEEKIDIPIKEPQKQES